MRKGFTGKQIIAVFSNLGASGSGMCFSSSFFSGVYWGSCSLRVFGITFLFSVYPQWWYPESNSGVFFGFFSIYFQYFHPPSLHFSSLLFPSKTKTKNPKLTKEKSIHPHPIKFPNGIYDKSAGNRDPNLWVVYDGWEWKFGGCDGGRCAENFLPKGCVGGEWGLWVVERRLEGKERWGWRRKGKGEKISDLWNRKRKCRFVFLRFLFWRRWLWIYIRLTLWIIHTLYTRLMAHVIQRT